MLDGVPLGWLGQVGATGAGWSLAAVAVWFVLTGRLVPRRVLEDQREATASWRTAYEAERARSDRLIEPSAQLQRQVLGSLPSPEVAAPLPVPEGTAS